MFQFQFLVSISGAIMVASTGIDAKGWLQKLLLLRLPLLRTPVGAIIGSFAVLAKNVSVFDRNVAYVFIMGRVYVCGSPFRLILKVCLSSIPLRGNAHLFAAAYYYIGDPSLRVVIVTDSITTIITFNTTL